ncbi:fungal-specific transcription factor domain-containing protein [Sordaria brevicollis]|uniref:Fungal-specific transcription factor domain-containing protein n=1 Tax=Sordaria brevicollis TaxID=83679 RepID=A0AAE0P2K7_SORBR|nr:fungal-specific transcription factor domain-containing protein [Sordaria brevicollis]
MSMQAYDAGAVTAFSRVHPEAMSLPRPQVGIERLPTRRLSNEPRESMNCKSCRKRKIKCNRLRPACEACQIFQCPCIYDAVPKKRGPKTDVLEALLRRVDGLEARLKEKGEPETPMVQDTPHIVADSSPSTASTSTGTNQREQFSKDDPLETPRPVNSGESQQPFSQPQNVEQQSISMPEVQPTLLFDTYFSRFHAKPFHVLDESTFRQRLQLHQTPNYLVHAVCAVAARYTPHPKGYQSAIRLSEDYAARSRSELDTDEPSVDALQALLLLVTAFTAAGKGKKAYMLLTNAVGMAMALELHREMDINARVTPIERETRRRLFWSCYLLDRFMVSGSKRPSLIRDKTVLLRLPSWSPNPSTLPMEGDFFQSGSNLQYFHGSGKRSQGSNGLLIDITRILGTTNQYLASGGAKGDSHFPWHSLSNLSKIRQDLDVWASGTEDAFSSLHSLFGHTDSTVLVLSKLIYHLVHCLIYRPFLPIDLSELAGSGQHQSWQIEATNMCFLHANAIAELVELGKQMASIEWPAFVGYCICTAGTVHVHGAHYSRHGITGEMNVFSSSPEFLSREMQQLSELRYSWASVQHQRETLQSIYDAHSELVKNVANNSIRYSPVFHLEDFFDRYANINGPGGQSFTFDAANLSLADVIVDFTTDTYPGHDLYAPRLSGTGTDTGTGSSSTDTSLSRPNLKRKNTAPSGRKRPDIKSLLSISGNGHFSTGLPTPTHPHTTSFPMSSSLGQGGLQPSPGIPPLTQQQPDLHGDRTNQFHSMLGSLNDSSTTNSSTNTFSSLASSNHQPRQSISLGQGQGISSLSNLPSAPSSSFRLSPQLNFSHLQPHRPATPSTHHTHHHNFDPMFGDLPTNAFSSPAPWNPDDTTPHQLPNPTNTATGGNDGDKPTPSDIGSTSTEDKDPFLSLLEQLAENESLGLGGELDGLDFFLGLGGMAGGMGGGSGSGSGSGSGAGAGSGANAGGSGNNAGGNGGGGSAGSGGG